MCVADRFELDSLSDLVQKCVPASAGHRPLLLLHLLQLGPLSDLAQQSRLPGKAIPSVSVRERRRRGGRRAGRWRRRRRRRRAAT